MRKGIGVCVFRGCSRLPPIIDLRLPLHFTFPVSLNESTSSFVVVILWIPCRRGIRVRTHHPSFRVSSTSHLPLLPTSVPAGVAAHHLEQQPSAETSFPPQRQTALLTLLLLSTRWPTPSPSRPSPRLFRVSQPIIRSPRFQPSTTRTSSCGLHQIVRRGPQKEICLFGREAECGPRP